MEPSTTASRYVVNFGVTCDFGSASKTRTGWTIGGGVEWRFAPQWSAFLEGNYYDYGNNNRTITTNNFFVTHLRFYWL